MNEITEPTRNDHGDEVHPSFGVAQVHRVTAHPAHHLFDSSIGHTEYVTLTVQRASRKRNLSRDWIHTAPGRPLIEIEMSMSQWGSLISGSGSSRGTPVTIHEFDGETMPQAPHTSRLAVTAQEVSRASRQAVKDVQLALDAVDAAFEERAGRRDMQKVLQTLRSTVSNLPANMKFAADSLTEHAEDVVAKATADIEAVTQFGSRVLPEGNYIELEG